MNVDEFYKFLENKYQVTEEVFNARLEICNSCEFFNKNICEKSNCGCELTNFLKFKVSECPEKKF